MADDTLAVHLVRDVQVYLGMVKHDYFWMVGGFACLIIVAGSGLDSASSFTLAITRTKETALGIFVYTAVSLLLWQKNSGKAFLQSYRSLIDTYGEFFSDTVSRLSCDGKKTEHEGDEEDLRHAERTFSQLLDAAQIDSFSVADTYRDWQTVRQRLIALCNTLTYLQRDVEEVIRRDLCPLVPSLKEFFTTIQLRFDKLNKFPEPAVSTPQKDLARPSMEALKNHSHLDRVVVLSFLSHLQQVDTLLIELESLISAIRERKPQASFAIPEKTAKLPALDRENIVGVIQVMASVWIAFALHIYVEGMPGGGMLVAVTGSIAWTQSTTPMLRLTKLLIPLFSCMVIVAALYFFIMPRLTGFAELGFFIFVFTFVIGYIFHSPQQRILKLLLIICFVSMANISNNQVYSFYAASNFSLLLLIAIMIVIPTTYVPFRQQAKWVMLGLIQRFFRSSLALMSRSSSASTMRRSWLQRYHLHEMSTIPAKLKSGLMFVSPAELGMTDLGPLQRVVGALERLADQLLPITEGRHPLPPFPENQEMAELFRRWQKLFEEAMLNLVNTPEVEKQYQAERRLSEIYDDIERKMEQLSGPASRHVPENTVAETAQWYRFIAIGQGLSEALRGYITASAAIDWRRWHEERF
jgi:hypothetical protein